ncbi:CRISPR-associated endonuclease Cas2 [Thermodesulfobacteriota bacterium]
MQGHHNTHSEYKSMWLFAMFDLPVVTKEDRLEYTRFRKKLLTEGFLMLQYSVYARYCASEEVSKSHRRRIKAMLPPRGEVRMLSVTDRQWGKMDVFQGKRRYTSEEPPKQLLLF